MFSAIKLMQRELGPTHISADIGCHSFATFAPFSLGNSILGYGMSLASAAAVGPQHGTPPDRGHGRRRLLAQRPDHRRRLQPVQQGRRRADRDAERLRLGDRPAIPAVERTNRTGTPTGMTIEQTLRSLGVKWLRTVRSYSVARMAKTLKEAMRTAERGLKVIIADGECQLARQRRVRAEDAEKLKRGERVVRDALRRRRRDLHRRPFLHPPSGCPSLTVKPNPDPLRTDPVATVIESCVGCGLCGEVAHAAVLCPSFYRAEIIRNPNWWDRALHRVRRTVIGWFGGRRAQARA